MSDSGEEWHQMSWKGEQVPNQEKPSLYVMLSVLDFKGNGKIIKEFEAGEQHVYPCILEDHFQLLSGEQIGREQNWQNRYQLGSN